jgi:NADH-quinone oxidoreductase subunit N
MWTPDVYEGAPTPVTAFFASAPKFAAMALFLRVMASPFDDLTAAWQQIIWFLSVGSMLLGSLAAIRQRNIKRLLAYSAIGQIGFALVGLAAGTPDGVRGVLIYMAIYIVMTIGAFCVVLCMKRHGRMVEDIGDLAGLAKTHPMMALAMGIFMFSMAGIPPLAGFFAKLYVFLAAIEAGMVALAVIGVLTSVIAAYYYLNIVKIMYFDDAGEVLDRGIGREMAAIQVVTGGLIALFFLYPGPLLSGAEAAVKSLGGG